MSENKKRCYVIAPYEKKDIGGGRVLDFEEVYQTVIRKSVESIRRPPLIVHRSKDEPHAGIITENFIKGIFESDIVIIDVSGGNPNVYYELGLRHAFRKRISVLIGFKGTVLPFDIAGFKVIWYDHTDEEARERSVRDIADHIQDALDHERVDSPVYKFLPDLSVSIPQTRCKDKLTYEYEVQGSESKRIGIKTGAIYDIKDVDVWVNSENTDMEMARPYERSISSNVRYLGAVRDISGRVKDDLIQKYLSKQLGKGTSVAPATVIVTEPGELRSRGVKKLLHVASVQGQPGTGYQPIQDLHLCVTRSLEKLHEINSKSKSPELLSVLIPIFGTGQGGKDPAVVIEELVSAAYQFVKSHPQSAVSRIYFLAYYREQLALCRDVFAKFEGLKEIGQGF